MVIRRLWLTDFRSYAEAEVDFAPGLTVILGANGEGKTNLLEAIGWLATLSSFRGAPNEALVRVDPAADPSASAGASGGAAGRAIVRAEIETEGREVLIEAEIGTGSGGSGRSRVQVNRQRLGRARDLLGIFRVSVFSPDDLELVKGGPGERRRYLDDTLVSLHPRYDTLRSDVERVLRQRNAMLRQLGGRLDDDAAFTLDVWDAKLTEAGEALARARQGLVRRLTPALRAAYSDVAGPDARTDVALHYDAPWLEQGLAAALVSARRDEIRRGVSLVGPHRDELVITLAGLPARTHASQGEQRSLAFALRVAAHAVVTEETGTAPVLLLDDVFSELDDHRSAALLEHLPPGQTVLTSAIGLPPGAGPDRVFRIKAATIVEG